MAFGCLNGLFVLGVTRALKPAEAMLTAVACFVGVPRIGVGSNGKQANIQP